MPMHPVAANGHLEVLWNMYPCRVLALGFDLNSHVA